MSMSPIDRMPELGGASRRSWARPVIAAAGVAIGVVGAAAWWRHRQAPPPPPAVAASPIPAAAAATEPPAPPSAPPVADPAPQTGPRHVSVTVEGPLETSIVRAVGRDVGRQLSQVVVRSLVWWLDVPGDLRKGDTLDVVYEPRDGEEPLVHAVRYQSLKRQQTYRAYRFKPAGASFARYYQPSGEELEQRLKDGPISDYEQVTSLLRDGRGHKGVDFKTPVGTPVSAPFDAVVGRVNWNFRGNGNSIELRESGGAHRAALLLHLSESEVKPGQSVKRGEVVAKSGNTGHSFAPHLHYQLMQGEKVLDPFTQHDTYRRALPAEQLVPFQAEVRRLDVLLGALALAAGN